SIVVWDLKTGKEQLRRDQAFQGRAATLAPDGASFVLDAGKVSDVRTGRSRPPLQLPPEDRMGGWTKPAFAFSHDGRLVASGISHVTQTGGRFQTQFDGAQVWEVATGRPLAHIPAGELGCLAFSPDGRTLVTANWDSLRGWDVVTGEQVWSRSVGSRP